MRATVPFKGGPKARMCCREGVDVAGFDMVGFASRQRDRGISFA